MSLSPGTRVTKLRLEPTNPVKRCASLLVLVVGVIAAYGVAAQPQANPYRLVESWPQLPSAMNGGEWGETIGVDRDPEGNI